MLAVDIPARLMLSHNTSTGGCISEDTELSIVVDIVELETVWEKFTPTTCSIGFLGREPGIGGASGASASSLPGSDPPTGSTTWPTAAPTASPSTPPTFEPTMSPTASPTGSPTVSPTASLATYQTESSDPCDMDVCADICALACTEEGTYVQKHHRLHVQCFISDKKGPEQCSKETSGLLGTHRYDGQNFGEADVDVICCLGNKSCKNSKISLPSTNQVCCESRDGKEACRKARFASSSTSRAVATCKGENSCMESVWSTVGQVDACCTGKETCNGIDL